MQQTTKQFKCVFYPQSLKELNLDPSLVSNTYAKQILRSLKSEAAKSSNSSFVSDNPATEESKRSKPSSSKTRSTTLKLKTKQPDKRKTQNFPPPTTIMTTMIKSIKAVKNRLRRQQKIGNPIISEEKKIILLYV